MAVGAQEAGSVLTMVQDTMRLDRPEDKRDADTHVSGTRVLFVAWLRKIGRFVFRSLRYASSRDRATAERSIGPRLLPFRVVFVARNEHGEEMTASQERRFFTKRALFAPPYMERALSTR